MESGDLREAPDARSMNLCDGVLDLLALDGFLDRAILDLPFQADELSLLERYLQLARLSAIWQA